MTKADKEYIEMASTLSAQKAVKDLACNNHNGRIGEIEQVVFNGLGDKVKDNSKGIKSNRKFLFFGIGILFLTVVAGAIANNLFGQEIVYTNQVTVTWDITTTLADGRPIPAEDAVTYEVYRNDELMDEIDLPPYTMTIEPEITTRVGVRAKRVTAVYGEVMYSEYAWSDIGGVPGPWVVRHILPPGNVENIRIGE